VDLHQEAAPTGSELSNFQFEPTSSRPRLGTKNVQPHTRGRGQRMGLLSGEGLLCGGRDVSQTGESIDTVAQRGVDSLALNLKTAGLSKVFLSWDVQGQTSPSSPPNPTNTPTQL
jgi:uncharacterized protein YidB (DUF937 family)